MVRDLLIRRCDKKIYVLSLSTILQIHLRKGEKTYNPDKKSESVMVKQAGDHGYANQSTNVRLMD